MNYIIVANKKPIVIGRQGENEVTTVRFSINALFPNLANADFGLVHQRHGDVAPYPCVINNINGFIEWVVGSGDLANVGSGTAQLSAYKDGLIEKTEIFTTVTLDSMGMTDPPEATQAWVDELLQAGFRAESAAETAEGAAEDAQEILDNIGTTVDNALAEAKASGDFDGPQGDPGFSPTVSVTTITGGHRVSITDEEATNTFDVMDGDKGDDGVSPTITSEAIAGGHRLTIVDADGTTTVDVMDGEDGADVFWATKDTTTSAQIEAAYQAGKVCLCEYSSRVYRLNYRTSSTQHTFTMSRANTVYALECNNDAWSSTTYALAQSANIPQAASNAPADLGTAAKGSSSKYAREDHVHKMPSASDVGAASVSDLLALYPHTTVTGSIASFADGADNLPVRDLTVAIAPVQDLHGYDSPWPAGGGKNKLPITISSSTTSGVTFTVNSDGTISLSGTATADVNQVINSTTKLVEGQSYKLAGCASGSDGSNYYMRSTRGITSGSTGAGFSTPVTATGEALYLFIHISNGVNTSGLVFKPMICLSTENDYTFAPYANICPITGRTGANVKRTGKNILPNKTATGSGTQVNLGQDETGTDAYKVFLKAGTYTLSYASTVTCSAYYRTKNGDSNIRIIQSATSGSGSFTLTEDSECRIWLYNSEGFLVSNVSWFQLEVGSTATAYEPYAGTTIPISWQSAAGTVYGGTLDVTTGVLTVDRAIISYNSSTGFATHSSGRWYHAGLPSGFDYDQRTKAISNEAQYGDKTQTYAPWFAAGSQGIYINRLTSDETIEQFDARLQTTPFQICYYISTPATYQLTATEVKTLLGDNAIWADTGNTTVDYRADPTLFVTTRELAPANGEDF